MSDIYTIFSTIQDINNEPVRIRMDFDEDGDVVLWIFSDDNDTEARFNQVRDALTEEEDVTGSEWEGDSGWVKVSENGRHTIMVVVISEDYWHGADFPDEDE